MKGLRARVAKDRDMKIRVCGNTQFLYFDFEWFYIQYRADLNSNSLISYLCKLMVNINILNTKGLQH